MKNSTPQKRGKKEKEKNGNGCLIKNKKVKNYSYPHFDNISLCNDKYNNYLIKNKSILFIYSARLWFFFISIDRGINNL